MSSTLHINRGAASHDRVVTLDGVPIGRLEDQDVDFPIPSGHHLVVVRLGHYGSVARRIFVAEGRHIRLRVVDNPDAAWPLFLGGYVKLVEDDPGGRS